jgi:hypothetical protein
LLAGELVSVETVRMQVLYPLIRIDVGTKPARVSG